MYPSATTKSLMIMRASCGDDYSIRFSHFDTGLTTRVFLATSPRRCIGLGRQLTIGIAVSLIVINNISDTDTTELGNNRQSICKSCLFDIFGIMIMFMSLSNQKSFNYLNSGLATFVLLTTSPNV